jgi:hypothetical protein
MATQKNPIEGEERLGCRLLTPTGISPTWFSRNFGEDWIVPKGAIVYLVLHRKGASSQLTAFDKGGLLVGEVHQQSGVDLLALLSDLVRDGLTSELVAIPSGKSALDTLRA